ncbi:hypothetical protein JCM8547_006359 [Rhodosporidiobolus lusitaniae]
MAPKLVVRKAVASLPLDNNALPGGGLLDLFEFPSDGPISTGFFVNHGTEAAFDVPSYPAQEVKYIVSGELKVIEDGKEVSAGPGDAIYIPTGAAFTILPTRFTSFYATARPASFKTPSAKL